MKLSELIKHAQEAKEKHGDLEVAVYECRQMPVSVKSDIVCVSKVADGHGAIYNEGKAAFIILP